MCFPRNSPNVHAVFERKVFNFCARVLWAYVDPLTKGVRVFFAGKRIPHGLNILKTKRPSIWQKETKIHKKHENQNVIVLRVQSHLKTSGPKTNAYGNRTFILISSNPTKIITPLTKIKITSCTRLWNTASWSLGGNRNTSVHIISECDLSSWRIAPIKGSDEPHGEGLPSVRAGCRCSRGMHA